MLKINSLVYIDIEMVLFGTLDEINLLKADLTRYVTCFNSTSITGDYQNNRIYFTVTLSSIKKVNKIIEKHTQYFSDIKKYKKGF